MGNPEAPKTLPVAENLDDRHRQVATNLGIETWRRMEELISESRRRRTGSGALQAAETDVLKTA